MEIAINEDLEKGGGDSKSTLSDLLADYEATREKIKKLLKLEYELKRKISILNCPYSIGDIMVNRDGVKAKIVDIQPNWDIGDYILIIRKIKKDGGLYKSTNKAHPWDKWTLYSPTAQ